MYWGCKETENGSLPFKKKKKKKIYKKGIAQKEYGCENPKVVGSWTLLYEQQYQLHWSRKDSRASYPNSFKGHERNKTF